MKTVSRLQGRQFPAATMQAIFKAEVDKLPAYAGAGFDGSYVLYKIVKVNAIE